LLAVHRGGRKAYEIWSHAMMAGRQRVNTQGAVPKKESQNPFLQVSTRIGSQSSGKAASELFVDHDTKDGSM